MRSSGAPAAKRLRTAVPRDPFATVSLARTSAVPSLNRRKNISRGLVSSAVPRALAQLPTPSAVLSVMDNDDGEDMAAPLSTSTQQQARLQLSADASDTGLDARQADNAVEVDENMILSDNDVAPVEDVELPVEEEPRDVEVRGDDVEKEPELRRYESGAAAPGLNGGQADEDDDVLDLTGDGQQPRQGAPSAAKSSVRAKRPGAADQDKLQSLTLKMRHIKDQQNEIARQRRAQVDLDSLGQAPDTAFSRQLEREKATARRKEQLRLQEEKRKAHLAKQAEKKKKLKRRKKKALAKMRGEAYVSESEDDGVVAIDDEEEEEEGPAPVQTPTEPRSAGDHGHVSNHGASNNRHRSDLQRDDMGRGRGRHNGYAQDGRQGGRESSGQDDYYDSRHNRRGPPLHDDYRGPPVYSHGRPPPPGNRGPPPDAQARYNAGGPSRYNQGQGYDPHYQQPHYQPPYYQQSPYPPNPPYPYPPQMRHSPRYPPPSGPYSHSPYDYDYGPPRNHGPPHPYPPPSQRGWPGQYPHDRGPSSDLEVKKAQLHDSIRDCARDLSEADLMTIYKFLDDQRGMFAPGEREKGYLLQRDAQTFTELVLDGPSGTWSVVKKPLD